MIADNSTNTAGGANTKSAALKTGSQDTAHGFSATPDKTTEVFNQLYNYRLSRREERKNQSSDVDSELLSSVVNGDKAAASKVLQKLSPTIDSAIASIVNGDQRYRTRARLMALAALKDYDPKQGASLNTFIYNRLRGLQRIAADRGNFIHVPEKSALERRQLEGIKQDYMLENGVEPSLAELSDRSGMPIRKVSRLMSIFGTTSTGATRGEHGDSLEAKPRTATELYNDAFYLELPEMDKKIYEWSTGDRGSPQLDRATIASRLKVSEAAISQHVKRIDQMAADFNRTVNRSVYGDDGYGETD